jgi:hypothetical protein
MDAVLRLAAEAAARRMQQENDWKRVEKNVSSSLLNVTYCDEEAWRA